jgi:hypothetical protein
VGTSDSGGVQAAAGAGWASMGSARAGTASRRLVDRVGRVCGLGLDGLRVRGATATVQKSRDH